MQQRMLTKVPLSTQRYEGPKEGGEMSVVRMNCGRRKKKLDSVSNKNIVRQLQLMSTQPSVYQKRAKLEDSSSLQSQKGDENYEKKVFAFYVDNRAKRHQT